MGASALESEGFTYYVEELRRGSLDPYFAYRVCERGWQLDRKDRGLLRQAAIRLIESDPWCIATAMEDLERLTPRVGVGPTRKAAATLRAMLWYHGRGGPYRTDRAGRAQLRRALGLLQQVTPKQRDKVWHEMVVGCYRVLDYEKYKRAFPKLHALTDPAWRAFGLIHFLDDVTQKQDWRTYDRYRPEWDRLPQGHHACECYVNGVYTDDGLRAAAAGRWDEIPEALAKATAVRGCAHLNTRGLRLDLVATLIAKRKHRDAVRAYLDIAAKLEAGSERLATLRRKLDAAGTGRRRSAGSQP